MSDDFLQELASAANDDEREWLAIRDLLASIPPDLASIADAAAIPHWFDAQILAALRPELAGRAEQLYTDLQRLPFVEPFAGRGYNVHELTRRLMLAHLWKERRDDYVALSKNAADYFAELMRKSGRQVHEEIEALTKEETDEKLRAEQLRAWLEKNPDVVKGLAPQTRIEHVYHLLIADPEQGADALRDQGGQWHDPPFFAYSLVGALAEAASEHAEASRLNGKGRGWGRLWEGLTAYDYYQFPKAIAAFSEVIAGNYPDNKLNAEARRMLGDVHVRLSELPEARARYEEARPIYHAIGDKLGEANCIKALGELAAEEKDYASAYALLEDAAARYRALQLPAEEAGAINSIANVYDSQKDYQKAIEAYTRALALFPAQAGYILRNRANQYLKLKDAANAARDIEAAAKIQSHHPYLFLRRGELAILLGNYDEAITHFNSALKQYPRMNIAHFGIGLARLRAGRQVEALAAYQQGLSLTDACKELDDPVEELEKLKAEQPSLAGLDEALALLKSWKPTNL